MLFAGPLWSTAQMASFASSTQAKFWQFTTEQLATLREETNKKQAIKKEINNAEEKKIQTSSTDQLTLREEYQLRRFYELIILEATQKLNFIDKVQATAIVLFKRFYLKESVVTFDVIQIMRSCIYLATKVEEWPILLDDLTKVLKCKPEDILKLELNILETLRFQLVFYHPFHSLFALHTKVQELIPAADAQKTHDQAKALLSQSLTTDACLLFTPGQLALAAVEKVNSDAAKKLLDKLQKDGDLELSPELSATLNRIQSYLEECTKPVPKEEVVEIDRKLKFIRNPELRAKRKGRPGAEPDQSTAPSSSQM